MLEEEGSQRILCEECFKIEKKSVALFEEVGGKTVLKPIHKGWALLPRSEAGSKSATEDTEVVETVPAKSSSASASAQPSISSSPPAAAEPTTPAPSPSGSAVPPVRVSRHGPIIYQPKVWWANVRSAER